MLAGLAGVDGFGEAPSQSQGQLNLLTGAKFGFRIYLCYKPSDCYALGLGLIFRVYHVKE